MKQLKALAFLGVLFVATSVGAESRRVGHMEPFDNERLPNPVQLSCGVRLQEWQGSGYSSAIADRIGRHCTVAVKNFFRFIQKKKLVARDTNRAFTFNLSMLRDTKGYRGLNDTTYRFRYRGSTQVYGYTDYSTKYMFITNDTRESLFDSIIVHETFHALSIFYGVYMRYGNSWEERTRNNERLAREFVRWLDYPDDD